LTSCQ